MKNGMRNAPSMRLPYRSGVPEIPQCTATRSGSREYTAIENNKAPTMNDAGNHLRIGPPWRFGPIEHMLDDLLKDCRVELVANVLAVALGQHEIGVAKDTEVS